MPFTLTMPKMSPTMESGTIASWHKKVGDHVEAGDLLIEVATDKATVEFNALDGGWLKKILVSEGVEAIVNQPIAIFTEEKNEGIEGYQPEGDAPQEKQAAAPSPKPKTQAASTKPAFVPPPVPPTQSVSSSAPVQPGQRLLVSPLAKKLAKEQGIELAALQGSGPGGRIMKRDLERTQPPAKQAFSRKQQPTETPGAYEEIALTPIRKIIAQRLQEAKATIPHFYVQQAINVQSLIDIREQLKNCDVNLTFNDFMIKACALALREHPGVNSGFNSENNTILRFKTIDISVAVNVESGLVTPIVRFADYKNLSEISEEVKALAAKAKAGKLAPHEFQGGSFTISNMGMHGINDFQAIINPPQGAILAVSGILDQPIVKNNAVVPGKVMNVTLSVDHRVIDGVAAAEFLKTLKNIIENPAFLLL